MKVLRKVTPVQVQRTKLMCLGVVACITFAALTSSVADAQETTSEAPNSSIIGSAADAVSAWHLYQKDSSPYFMGQVNREDLVFGIVSFAACATLCLVGLGLRYAFTGVVRGGSSFSRYATAFLLFVCWFAFVALNAMNAYDVFGNRNAVMAAGAGVDAHQLGCQVTDIVNPVAVTDLGAEVKLQWQSPQAATRPGQVAGEPGHYDQCEVQFLVTNRNGESEWQADQKYCDCNSTDLQEDGQTIYASQSCKVPHAHLNRGMMIPACAPVVARVRYASAGEWCSWSEVPARGNNYNTAPKVKGCPSELQDFRARLLPGREVALSWQSGGYGDGCDPIITYEMEMKTIKGWVDINVKGDASEYFLGSQVTLRNQKPWRANMKTLIELEDCQSYEFRGRAVNSQCEGDYSPAASAAVSTECASVPQEPRDAREAPMLKHTQMTQVLVEEAHTHIQVPTYTLEAPLALPQLGRVYIARQGCGFVFTWSAPRVCYEAGEAPGLSYDIQVQQGDGTYKAIGNRAGCGASGLGCSLTREQLLTEFNLQAGQRIVARGRAGVSRGWGQPGAESTSDLTLLGAPQAFARPPTVVLVGNSGVRVSWEGSSYGAGGVSYSVQQSVNGVAATDHRATQSTFLTYTNLSVGTEYCYRVKAVGTCGVGNFSERSCIQLRRPPPAAPRITVVQQGCSIRIGWASADGFAGGALSIEIQIRGGASYVDLSECVVSDSASVNECTLSMASLTAGSYGLAPGSAISIRGRVSRSDGQLSGWGVQDGYDIRVVSAPGAPLTLSHTVQGRQAFLTWSPVSGATGYEISDGSGLTQRTQETSWTLSNLVQSVNYEVRATNSCGAGPWAYRNIVVDVLPGCMAVSVRVHSCRVHFAWSAPIKNGDNITSYRIAVQGAAGYTTLNQCGQDGTTNSCSLSMDELVRDHNLRPGAQIFAVGTATNSYGESACVAQAAATGPQVVDYNVTYDTRFSLAGATQTSCSFNWSSYQGINFTRIFWDGGNGASWGYKELQDTSGLSSFTKSGLTPGSSYRFKLQAASECGAKQFSPEVVCTIVQPPPGPMAPIRVTPGCSQVQLDWAPPTYTGGSPIVSYRIEMSYGSNGRWFQLDQCGNAAQLSCTVPLAVMNSQKLLNGDTHSHGYENGADHTHLDDAGYIKVRGVAYNGVGWGLAPSQHDEPGAVLLRAPTVPAAPVLTATLDAGSITVQYRGYAGSQAARIMYAEGQPVNFAEVAPGHDWRSTGTYTLRSMKAGAVYWFRASATNSCGTAVSEAVSILLATRPGRMAPVVITGLGCSIGMSWTAPASSQAEPITGYELQVYSRGGWVELTACQRLNNLNVSRMNECNLSLAELAKRYGINAGEALRVRARASNTVGWAREWSSDSAAADAYRVQSALPGAVTNLTMRSDRASGSRVSFTWDSPDADSYQFQQADAGGAWRDYNAGGGSTYFRVGSGLEVTLRDPCTSSRFRVRAVRCGTEGAWSDVYTLDRAAVPGIMSPVLVREARCGAQLSWQAPATGCGAVTNYKLEIQSARDGRSGPGSWVALSACSTLGNNNGNNQFNYGSCHVPFATLRTVYGLAEGQLIQVRAYAENGTGWQTSPSAVNLGGNGLRVRGSGGFTSKTVVSFVSMTADAVSFRWASDAFVARQGQQAGASLGDGAGYEVWFDEGEAGRPVSNFVLLAGNVATTSYTYRGFTRKYARRDAVTGAWKVNYRFYVAARSACAYHPNSNLLEVLVSVRDKGQSRASVGVGASRGQENEDAQGQRDTSDQDDADQSGSE